MSKSTQYFSVSELVRYKPVPKRKKLNDKKTEKLKMPKISKATVVQEITNETQPVRKKAKQKSQGSLLSESSSGTSGPTTNNNLEGSTNSKVLAKQASWTDPMELSDQATISDAGKVPSGKKGDSTASTSKRPTPARNAKGRWARKSRAKKTPADKQVVSKDDQSDANSQLIIGQDVAAVTADLITGDTNCCPASTLNNDETQPDRKGSTQKRQRSPLSELNSGTSSPTPKINPETPPTPKFWNSKQGRWTVVIPDDHSTASTSKRPIPARNANGRWARKPRSTKTRADMQDESKDDELPIQICSQRTRKRAAQDFITESISDPNQIIKTEAHDFELPIQWGTVKKEVPESELPFQSGSQSSGKKTATESNSCAEFSPNKTVKKEGDSIN